MDNKIYIIKSSVDCKRIFASAYKEKGVKAPEGRSLSDQKQNLPTQISNSRKNNLLKFHAIALHILCNNLN